MKSMQSTEVFDLIKDWVVHHQQHATQTPHDIREETDLISTGLLDSMGFVELLVFIEKETGTQIDLSEIDPGGFTTMRGLCTCILNNGDESSAGDQP